MRVCHCTLHLTNPEACKNCQTYNHTIQDDSLMPGNRGEIPIYNPIWTKPSPSGWVCPKCGRVYANWVFECRHCNEQASEKEARVNVSDADVKLNRPNIKLDGTVE